MDKRMEDLQFSAACFVIGGHGLKEEYFEMDKGTDFSSQYDAAMTLIARRGLQKEYKEMLKEVEEKCEQSRQRLARLRAAKKE